MPPGAPLPGAADASDGARSRLLAAALALFAEHGFAKTSTRQLAEAAGVNVAAIRYYFGDKQGLYRTAMSEPFGDPGAGIARFDQPQQTLREALEAFFCTALEPLKQGEVAQQCLRLHFRELLEPTGLLEQEMAQTIRPEHDALLRVLRRHLGLARNDADLHRLALTLAGMAIHLFVGRDIVNAVLPSLLKNARAIDTFALRLADYGCALVAAERARRAYQPDPTRLPEHPKP